MLTFQFINKSYMPFLGKNNFLLQKFCTTFYIEQDPDPDQHFFRGRILIRFWFFSEVGSVSGSALKLSGSATLISTRVYGCFSSVSFLFKLSWNARSNITSEIQ
jgi:hypothetical protein